MTLRSTALTVALLAVAPLASAGTANDSFQVSITIENSCSIVANDLDFGTQNTLANDIDAQTSIDVTCTGISPLVVSLDNGAGAGATAAARKLTNGASTIDYVLAKDAARLQVLGTGADTITALATGGTDTFPIYGRVLANQNPKIIGQYLDTVTATVSF